MSNSVFQAGEPFWVNACVGNNGFINYLTYAEGFSEAAKVLLAQVLNNHGNNIDSFIYPICFNMRHSIELRLKGAIEKLNNLAEVKKQHLDSFSLAQSHDIGNIWKYFLKSSEKLDVRFKVLNDKINIYILDIADVDSTGQTFRYPFDNDNNRHLTNEANISCLVLSQVFKEVEETLSNIDYLIDALIEEYKTGSFTSYMSRSQIYNLAKTLPKRNEWGSKLDKEKIKQQYGFTSNKQLINILDIIQKNYEMSSFIGKKLPLKSIPDNLIIDLLIDWALVLKPDFKCKKQDEFSSDEFEIYFEKMKNYHSSKQQIFAKYSNQLNEEVLADLYCLFYFLRDHQEYSERYDFFYDTYKNDIKHSNNLRESFEHIYTKRNFLEQTLKSLYYLGQIDVAEKIVVKLKLENHFNFIEQARDRSLFKRWEYLAYE